MVDALAAGSQSLPTKVEQISQEKQGGEKQGGPAPLSATVLPSFAEASALLSGRYSCLVLDTHRRHIALHPKYLGRKKTGIRDQLNIELLRYSEGLNGVPVAYDDIKIVGELGDIYDDQGHIHLNIEAEFVVFRPKAGEKLVGVVNKVAPTHIGCLVHGCFNASISKPFKMSLEDWQNLGVKVNDHLEFEVFRLDSDAVGVFCIRGKLDFESLIARSSKELLDENASTFGDTGQNLTNPPAKRPCNIVENGNDVDSETEDAVIQFDVHTPNDTGSDMDILPLQEKAKKKKKKHKREDAVINGSDLSGLVDSHKRVKKKKRKRSEEDEIPELSLEPKLKKKKRE